METTEQTELDNEKSFKEFWIDAGYIKKGDGIQMFPNLNLLVQHILLFSYSAATVERIFSQIHWIWSRIRLEIPNVYLKISHDGGKLK